MTDTHTQTGDLTAEEAEIRLATGCHRIRLQRTAETETGVSADQSCRWTGICRGL